MERLDKLLSAFGNMSRGSARDLVKSGAVRVNGAAACNAGQKCLESDHIEFNGKTLNHEKHVYYMMNKPAGVLSATTDPCCETVLDLLPTELRRKGLFPAGRLDKDAEGFALITDDGVFAHNILSPKKHVPKTYFVRLDKPAHSGLISAFAQGLELGRGDVCAPARLELSDGGLEAELVIYEGMYHQVKRMFLEFSLEVVYLKRLAIGGLSLDLSIPAGGVKKIPPDELKLITTAF